MLAAGGGGGDVSYDGPYVSARDPGGHWLWVTDGARVARQDRSEPPLLSRPALLPTLSVELDDETVERVIDSYRREAWGLDDSSGEEEIDFAEEDAVASEAPFEIDDENLEVEQFADVAEESPDPPALRSDRLRVEPPSVRVNVLGNVAVEGWQEIPSRAIVVELACYLALHPGRPVPSDELRAALWPDGEREASAKSLRTYMSLLRRSLGAEHVPPATGAGYRLAETVTSDWAAFVRLTREDAGRRQLEEALGLVRGRPFSSTSPGSFGWVYCELLVSEMEVTIAGAACRLADLCLGDGDVDGAVSAVRRGLLAVPFDLNLWGLHLNLAARQGHGELSRARKEVEAALGELAADMLSDSIGE